MSAKVESQNRVTVSPELATSSQCGLAPAAADTLTPPEPSIRLEGPNQQLLAVCPELSNFWDGDGWIVTADRLKRAAEKGGIRAVPEMKAEVADLFELAIPFDACRIERVQGARVARQPDALLLEDTLGETLTMTLTLECNSAQGVDNLLPIDALCDVRLYQLVAPKGVSVDRSVVGDAIVHRLSPLRSEAVRVLADKVAQRNLVKTVESSAIEQPRYLDARGVNPPDAHVEFRNISFRHFPLREIAGTPATEKKVWIFEDCRQGFAVVSDGRRQYVYSDNPVVRELLVKHRLDETPSKKKAFSSRLEGFLRDLSEAPHYGVCLLKTAPDLDQERLALARSILNYKGECFVKSSRSSDGILVLRVQGGAEGEAVIHSNSVEVGELLKHFISHIESIREAARRRGVSALDKVALYEQVESVRRRVTMEGFLERSMLCMEAPIVEESIPVARLLVPQGPEKVEVRLIFQGTDEVELAGHYVKASSNQTAANIACGGHSRRTYDVLYGLHAQHLEGVVSHEEIEQRVAKSFDCLVEEVTLIARKCASYYREVFSSRQLNDFALDICPVWDSERGSLRFAFLELQFAYGFSGLTATEPPSIGPIAEEFMAHRIAMFKSLHDSSSRELERLEQIRANLEILRAQLGLPDLPLDSRPRHSALRLLERRLLEEL